jgi:hypothetical protein
VIVLGSKIASSLLNSRTDRKNVGIRSALPWLECWRNKVPLFGESDDTSAFIPVNFLGSCTEIIMSP